MTCERDQYEALDGGPCNTRFSDNLSVIDLHANGICLGESFSNTETEEFIIQSLGISVRPSLC